MTRLLDDFLLLPLSDVQGGRVSSQNVEYAAKVSTACMSFSVGEFVAASLRLKAPWMDTYMIPRTSYEPIAMVIDKEYCIFDEVVLNVASGHLYLLDS